VLQIESQPNHCLQYALIWLLHKEFRLKQKELIIVWVLFNGIAVNFLHKHAFYTFSLFIEHNKHKKNILKASSHEKPTMISLNKLMFILELIILTILKKITLGNRNQCKIRNLKIVYFDQCFWHYSHKSRFTFYCRTQKGWNSISKA
jgi:hypothetical protein